MSTDKLSVGEAVDTQNGAHWYRGAHARCHKYLLGNSILNMFACFPADQNLEAHGSRALTSIVAGTATIGRSFGHSLRRAVSIRHSTTSSRYSRDASRPSSRPSSLHSTNSSYRHSTGAIVEEAGSPLHTGTFVDLRPNSMCEQEGSTGGGSNRSSIISNSSMSTISSFNPSEATLTLHSNGAASNKLPHSLSAVHHVAEGGSGSPILVLHPPLSSSSSSASSLHGGARSPQPESPQSLIRSRSPQHHGAKSPKPVSPQPWHHGANPPQPGSPQPQLQVKSQPGSSQHRPHGAEASPQVSSSSSQESLDKASQNNMFNTPL